MNYGLVVSWVSALLNLGASVGFMFAHDYRRSMYFLFAFAITVTVIWK